MSQIIIQTLQQQYLTPLQPNKVNAKPSETLIHCFVPPTQILGQTLIEIQIQIQTEV